ncbi:MAG: type III-A CRISPR-associated RAMP protein Csm3 [Candidatus Lokiarchaeota archaeon]|nr:type III-A CRISPR-associated RAMP protein Csm3 [Candidatus Lokiarchaeota archaeon]
MDNPIIRNPLSNEPYIPGSSLKGKFRSLLEKYLGKELINEVSKNPLIRIHKCDDKKEYLNCPVCILFGSSEKEINKPSRLIVRDAFLQDGEVYSKQDLSEKGDLPFSEIKTETVIDRITAQAMPRELERVPSGAEFKLDLIYDLYSEKDVEFLLYVFESMKLLEDDYLGGSGTRGSGQVEFYDLRIDIKEEKYYSTGTYGEGLESINKEATTPEEIIKTFPELKDKISPLI